MFITFSCGKKDSDYSISDSPEPDIKTVSISLHIHTLPVHDPLTKIPLHVTLTNHQHVGTE
jgi:hypothetical protein